MLSELLAEYKELFRQSAECIPGWKKIDKNDLFRTYCELKDKGDPMTDHYLSAVIYKFWYMLTTNFYNQLLKIASEEDAYNWLIDSVLYVTDHRPWENPENVLYNDPKGPEKAMSVKINSLKTNYFVSLTRDKRKANKYVYDIEDVTDAEDYMDEGNDFVIHARDISLYVVKDIILDDWKVLKYLECFILDSIVTLDECQESFTNLVRHLRRLDPIYLKGFSETYGIPYEEVLKAKEWILDPQYHKPAQYAQEIAHKVFTFSKDPRITDVVEDYRKVKKD